jgi:hypothetical protein
MHRNRALLSKSFCEGRGIETGALHHPTPLSPGAKVRYLDRMTLSELRAQYPELEKLDLVPVDIVDSGETLATLPDGLEGPGLTAGIFAPSRACVQRPLARLRGAGTAVLVPLRSPLRRR